jgi:two-component system sensor kinase
MSKFLRGRTAGGLICVKQGFGYTSGVKRRKPAQRAPARKPETNDTPLAAIIQSATDAIISVDERQRVVLFNQAAERIFRCKASDAVGRPLDRFIPERFRRAHVEHVRKFGATGTTVRRMGGEVALYGLRTDGEEFPIEASISHTRSGGKDHFTVLLRDITRRVTAEAEIERSHRQLRDLYLQMHEVREGERVRIARELHDELAQWLTALKMDVSWLSGKLPQDDERLRDRVERMKELVDSTVASVRRIASDLRPAMLDDLGVVTAIEHLLHQFSQRSGVVVGLETTTGDVEFKEPLATAIYRMVQEAVTNVARHARATEVRVTMHVKGNELTVSAWDNGIGISDAALQGGKSLGILGIKERALTLGGAAQVYKAPEGGTMVVIKVPLQPYRGSGRRP